MDPQTLAYTLRKELSDGFRLSNPKYGPENICKIMQSCWQADPKNRPTSLDVKTHFEATTTM